METELNREAAQRLKRAFRRVRISAAALLLLALVWIWQSDDPVRFFYVWLVVTTVVTATLWPGRELSAKRSRKFSAVVLLILLVIGAIGIVASFPLDK